MTTDTESKMLGYIRTNKQVRAHDLGRIFGISQVAVHKQLKKLLEKGQIKKMGKPPLVFYVPAPKTAAIPHISAAENMWVWDYEINKNWQPKTEQDWQWFLVRKINYGDFKGIKKDMLRKYFPEIKKWLDLGKRAMIENYLQKWN